MNKIKKLEKKTKLISSSHHSFRNPSWQIVILHVDEEKCKIYTAFSKKNLNGRQIYALLNRSKNVNMLSINIH